MDISVIACRILSLCPRLGSEDALDGAEEMKIGASRIAIDRID